MSEVHAQARTTPRTRAEIKNSAASLLELAKRYNISVATARKWKQRDSQGDLIVKSRHVSGRHPRVTITKRPG